MRLLKKTSEQSGSVPPPSQNLIMRADIHVPVGLSSLPHGSCDNRLLQLGWGGVRAQVEDYPEALQYQGFVKGYHCGHWSLTWMRITWCRQHAVTPVAILNVGGNCLLNNIFCFAMLNMFTNILKNIPAFFLLNMLVLLCFQLLAAPYIW